MSGQEPETVDDEIADQAGEMLLEMFYAAYEQEGLAPLGVMLERAFESLKEERERQQGAAEGFRAT